jgi:hypothetical protein
MRSIKYLGQISWVLVLIFMTLSGCKYDAPPSPLSEAEKQQSIIPVITRVLPEDAGSASEISLVGKNFSPRIEDNVVYFGTVQALIKSAVDTEIVVYRPVVFGDSIVIQVVVKGAVGVGKYAYYKLGNIMVNYGQFFKNDIILNITLDKDENMYAVFRANSNNLIRLFATGLRDTSFRSTVSKNTTDLQAGPDGYIYLVRKQDQVYRVSSGGGNPESWAKFADGTQVKRIDFDANGNMFGGGENSGLAVLRQDKSSQNFGIYKRFYIEGVRVFNDYVYVLARFKPVGKDTLDPQPSGIYRNPIISAEGQIDTSASELVLNWADTDDFVSSTFYNFTFSADGIVYIGTNNFNPILSFNLDDKSQAPLYYGMILPPVNQLSWGSDIYLYLLINRDTSVELGCRVIQLDIDKTSAPFYGRN